jgi:hypothetical protein
MQKFVVLIFFLLVSQSLILSQPAAQDMPDNMPDSLLASELSRLSHIYHLDSASLAHFDKIITFDRHVYVVKINNITYSEVRFNYPSDDRLNSLNRSKISQILYSDGRRDVFIPLDDRKVKEKKLVDTTRIIIKNQKDWMKVLVTENPVEVNNLITKGNIKASYEAEIGNAGNDELMRQAGIILKKKAAALKAHYVLIDTKFFYKAYGDLPKVEVTGRAFGYR